MIRLTDELWIGVSNDAYLEKREQIVKACNNLKSVGVTAILNVAHDLRCSLGWPDFECAQVGIVDGPGNEISGYCAAILALVSLRRKHDKVIIYDHDGGRSLAIALMYLNLVSGKQQPVSMFLGRWLTWGERLLTVDDSVRSLLPKVHPAHIEAFTKIPYGLLEALL